MTTTETGAKETLNELMNYSIVVIGYKGNSTYYKEIKNAKAQAYAIDLVKTDGAELDKKLNASFPLNIQSDLLKDIDYNTFDLKETVRQNKVKNREQVRKRLLPVVLPCANYQAQPAHPSEQRGF